MRHCGSNLYHKPQLGIHHRLEDLDETIVARLSLFVVLHDISKVNVGFQTQIWGSSDFPERTRRPSRAGHTQDLTPVLNGRDSATCE